MPFGAVFGIDVECGQTHTQRRLRPLLDLIEGAQIGFRFDLAPALARELHEVSKLSSFFDCIQQDPVISQVKLIAEPWDVGEGGYQVRRFPMLWTEWNGHYRDTMRRYWKGEDGHMRAFAHRLCGSADLYEGTGKTEVTPIWWTGRAANPKRNLTPCPRPNLPTPRSSNARCSPIWGAPANRSIRRPPTSGCRPTA